jgi:hypothetical protein
LGSCHVREFLQDKNRTLILIYFYYSAEVDEDEWEEEETPEPSSHSACTGVISNNLLFLTVKSELLIFLAMHRKNTLNRFSHISPQNANGGVLIKCNHSNNWINFVDLNWKISIISHSYSI